MQHIQLWLVLCPTPHWGSLQRSPDSQDLGGLLLRGKEGEWDGKRLTTPRF